MITGRGRARRGQAVTSPWVWLVVTAGVLTGVGYAVLGGPGAWRIGCVVIGAALGIGGVIRMVVSQRTAGLLAVRGRTFDTAALLVGAAVIILLSLVVPPGGR